jgi:hypothetical protein
MARTVYDPQTGKDREDPWTGTAAEAQTAYTRQRSADRKASDWIAWGWDEIGVRRVAARRTAARQVSGVGEDAFSTERLTGSTTECADVSFRDSNLFIEISYISAGGRDDAGRIRQGALTTARWVAKALRRQP